MLQILFAILAGILTIAAPCILPMLPILLGASMGQKSRTRPLLIVAGFIVSFAAASLLLSALIQNLHLSPNLLRDVAIVLLLIFGVLMIFPAAFEKLTSGLSGAVNRAGQMGQGSGNWGALVLGLVIGIVWTPCAGPILGAILTLIATQGTTARSTILVIAYALGAGIPMLIIAYGSQWLTTRVRAFAKYSGRLQQVFGVLVILLAIAMWQQYDIRIEAALTTAFPQSSLETKLVGDSNPIMPMPKNSSTSTEMVVAGQTQNTSTQTTGGQTENIDFGNYGPAPDFVGIDHWLNSPPLTIASLKGKVVLVDFWTFSCINCIRTLPYVTRWYNTYKDDGFVVVGVHTPEFTFEKDTGNVQNAINQFGIKYPVAQDNEYDTWNAYNNEYWPAEYLINKDGEIVYEHFGEGNYNVSENAIRELLGLNMDASAQTSTLGNIQSPEMYFEPSRLENLSPDQTPSESPQNYTMPSSLDVNTFGLGGNWQFYTDHAQLMQPGGEIKLNFSSGKVFMVASSAGAPVTLHITVDGKPQPDVTVQASQLYTLFNSTDYSDHTIDIQIPQAGLEAFTFTFG